MPLANHGPCPAVTSGPDSLLKQTTHALTSGPDSLTKQTTHAVTSGPESLSQQTTSTVTSGSDSTHTTPHVTTDPLHSSFLCTYVNSMDCDSLGIEIICGSDGRRYVNHCELAKETCVQPSLKAIDLSNCH
ncbi:uncharacterized protein LOC132722529 [Ruditapes philippinarum]|uniref:uncharacterized protein LOC132722529 n=1 Tax=Ruditapes philippinarum TaxID=129788 RepID=UPI00295AC6CE|nr:uncharacterized protein LOC132722529 [Ruditapes philippinarum]